MNKLTNQKPLILIAILLALLALATACSQAPQPAQTPVPPAETTVPTAAPAEPTATLPGSQMRVPFHDEGAGITLFHPPSWSAELDPVSGMLLVAPEEAANFRDISNALIVAGPSSLVGQAIVAGEEALTEARAEAAFQFLQANFAAPFLPEMTLGDEITIADTGQKERATVPYHGTTVQDVPVTGTLNLIVDGGQVAGALTLTTGGAELEPLLSEMVDSISLNPPAGQ